MLEVGSKAPCFTLPDKDGKPVSLVDFAGKSVLCFYPGDNTSGCTRQTCIFGRFTRNLKSSMLWSLASARIPLPHHKFAEKYALLLQCR